MNVCRTQRALAWFWLLARCARLIVVVPLHLWRALKTSRRLIGAYKTIVVPIVHAWIQPGTRRTEIETRLAGWALHGGYLVESYARLVGKRETANISVVAASFMRLYDDVLDERHDGPLVAKRLARLFNGKPVAPQSDLESIVVDLYRWLAKRVPPYHAETVYAHLRDVHRLQLDALEGRQGRTAAEVIDNAVRKGGAGMAILAGLASPRVETAEFAVLYRLGGLLQLIDDYDDVLEDKSAANLASGDQVRFGALVAELRSVSCEIVEFYGPRRARQFVDGLHIWLIIVGLRRLLDRAKRGRPGVKVTAMPRRHLTMITLRKTHIR
jgi:hypothetical protein